MGNKFFLATTKIPDELSLILELLKHEQLHTLNLDFFSNIDWELFIKLARHHRIYPILHKRLRKLETGLVPASVIRQLSSDYKRNTFQMLQLSGEMEQISKLFSVEGIRLLFLKGPMLGNELYGDISLRTSGDLDILIPLYELDRADSILKKFGYEKDDYIQSVLGDWKWRHHHVTYFHPHKRTKIEVHWRLNPGPGKEPNFDELWDLKKKCSSSSSPTYMLGNEDLFLFLVSHGSRHGWSRLRWLVDIHQMLNQPLSWNKTYKLLKKYHSDQIGGQALILANQLLGSKLTEEMLPILNSNRSHRLAQDAVFYLERMVNLHTDPIPDDIASYHKRHLFSLMGRRQKVFFLTSLLHPYPEDAETLTLPKQLHFLYFPLRPFLWAWRKTRRHAMP